MENFDPKSIYKYHQESNTYHMDIILDMYLDIFDNWDYSPLRKRDLDNDLTEFLKECTEEIPLKSKIQINFHLPQRVKDNQKEQKCTLGIVNFFNYLIYKKYSQIKELKLQTAKYFTFGMSFIIFAYFIQSLITNIKLLTFLPEGLFIGGWVLFWEAFSTIFFKINEFKTDIKEYQRIIDSKINFIYFNQ